MHIIIDPVLLFFSCFFVLRNEMQTELLVIIQPLDVQKDCLKYKVDKVQQRLYSDQTDRQEKRDC